MPAPSIESSNQIPGLKLVRLAAFGDDRGRFVETFRTEWFRERTWTVVQTNRSESRAGTLRGLHYHFHQVDYWHVIAGHLSVLLADLRRSSPAFKQTQIIDLRGDEPAGLFIPVGVAHGFYAHTDVTLTYIVDNYYDGSDEHGVHYADPELGLTVDLRLQHGLPLLSPRDQKNPLLRAIPYEQLPA